MFAVFVRELDFYSPHLQGVKRSESKLDAGQKRSRDG